MARATLSLVVASSWARSDCVLESVKLPPFLSAPDFSPTSMRDFATRLGTLLRETFSTTLTRFLSRSPKFLMTVSEISGCSRYNLWKSPRERKNSSESSAVRPEAGYSPPSKMGSSATLWTGVSE